MLRGILKGERGRKEKENERKRKKEEKRKKRKKGRGFCVKKGAESPVGFIDESRSAEREGTKSICAFQNGYWAWTPIADSDRKVYDL